MEGSSKTEVVCWSCHAPHSGGHFCAACGKIQPLSRETDYFALFGLPQKLWMDCAELEKLFHQLSWKLHPDNFVRGNEYERELSLERSAQLNDAYRALRDPVARVEYLLAWGGMRKEGAARQQAPPELLEEVFELNESLDELRAARASSTDGSALAALKKRLDAEEKKFEARLHEVDEELKRIAAEWDAALDASADDAKKKTLMSRMNDVLNRRSYIRNLVANVQKELAEV